MTKVDYEAQIREEERKAIGRYLQDILDDWRCSSTEVGEIAADLLKGAMPNYDPRKYKY